MNIREVENKEALNFEYEVEPEYQDDQVLQVTVRKKLSGRVEYWIILVESVFYTES